MNAEERKAGFKRLAWVIAGLWAAAFLLSLVFAGLGSSGRLQAFGAGCGVVGVALVCGGVMAFGRTGAIRRTAGTYQRATTDERKEAERLALGLFALGIMFSVVALTLG